MKPIDETIEEKGLSYVEVASGRNGYPRGVRKAVIFGTQAETEQFVEENGGKVTLLRKRDGWQFYRRLANISLPYRFGISDYSRSEDDILFEIRSEDDIEDVLTEECAFREMEGLPPAKCPQDSWDASEDMRDGDVIIAAFVGDSLTEMCTFRAEDTKWHDNDVWEYRIAVDIF